MDLPYDMDFFQDFAYNDSEFMIMWFFGLGRLFCSHKLKYVSYYAV